MKNWSLLPWGESYSSANVSVDVEKKNDYKSIYDAEAGDLAVVGYGHGEKDFYPTLSYGKSGIVKWCSKEGAAKKMRMNWNMFLRRRSMQKRLRHLQRRCKRA